METQPSGPAMPVHARPQGTSQLFYLTQLNQRQLIFVLHQYKDLISSLCSFGLACLDIGSGVVECLCKRGYIGANCERWACCLRSDTKSSIKTSIRAPEHCILIPTVHCSI